MAVNTTLNNYQFAALDAAVKAAAPGKVDGISAYGPGRAISLWLQGQPAVLSPSEEAAVQAVFDGHDPIFLTADKGTIAADGIDTATITVSASKPGAAGVTLLVNGSAVPVTLAGGTGTVQVSSMDPATITVSVQSPANRSTDSLSIKAA